MIEVQEALLLLLRGGGRGVLSTVISSRGSTPQRPGARMLLLPDQSLIGTVGGGAIEHAVLEVARECMRTGAPHLVKRDLGRDLGMCCGGSMEVFVEPIEGTPRLIVFGAGHVGRATAAIAHEIGFRVTVVDEREELNDPERFGFAERVLSTPRDARHALEVTPHDWLLVTTHDHRLDEEALDTYLHLPHRYLGVIGSRRKIVQLLSRIRARRGSLPDLEHVYAPVGLQLGAVSPQEIAVSVAAELIALRHGVAAPHLRALSDPRMMAALSGEVSAEDERS